MELGAGWALAGRTGRAAGAGVGRRERQQGAGRWTQARVAGVRTGAGVRQALGVRGCAGGRCRRAGTGGQRQAERAEGWASGSSAQGARQAGRAAAGRAGRAGRAGDERQARGQAWRGRAKARGWAWPGRWRVVDWASWASFGALCTWLSSGSVFGPGSTRYFPESPNEYCSL